jgi:hypothetical protein
VSITKGNVDDVDLSGVSFLVSWQLGANAWADVTINDKVTAAQRAALDTVMPLAFSGLRGGASSITTGPITLEMTETRVRFSTSNSVVDMELMRGSDGNAVRVLNLPSPLYQNYAQYRSTVHQHANGEHTFSHSDTNGFTSTWEAGSR